MPVLIISMQKHHGTRLKRLSDQLDCLGVKFEVIDAIEGESLYETFNPNTSRHDYFPWITRGTNVTITKGEIGCALSHFKAWEWCLHHNQDVIILEDDVDLDRKFDLPSIQNIFNKYPSLQFLYLGRKRIFLNKQDESQQELLFRGDNQILVPRYSYWACGYALTVSGAKSLLQAGNGVMIKKIIPLDEILPFAYGSTPYLEALIKKYDGLRPGFLVSGALKDLVVAPKNGAFGESGTFFSSPSTTHGLCPLIKLFTVATFQHEGLNILQETCLRYGFDLEVLGMGDEWDGGNMIAGPGGARKISELHRRLTSQSVTNESDLDNYPYLGFVDGFDAFINNGAPVLIEALNKVRLQLSESCLIESTTEFVVFGSESTCWPDKSLESQYPGVKGEKRFLNSGVFVGTTNAVKRMSKLAMLKTNKMSDDDQLIYTKLFLDGVLQQSEGFKIFLDTNRELCTCVADFASNPTDLVPDLRQNFVSTPLLSSNHVHNNQDDSSGESKRSQYVRSIFIHANGSRRSKFHGYGLSDYCGAGRIGVFNETYGSHTSTYLDRAYALNKTEKGIPTVLVLSEAKDGNEQAAMEDAIGFIKTISNPGKYAYPTSHIAYSVISEMRESYTPIKEGPSPSRYQSDDFVSFMKCVQSLIFSFEQTIKRKVDKIFYLGNDVQWSTSEEGVSRMFCDLIGTTTGFDHQRSRMVGPLLYAQENFKKNNFWRAIRLDGHQDIVDESFLHHNNIIQRKQTGLFCVPHLWDAFMCDADLFVGSNPKLTGCGNISSKFCQYIFETHGVIPKLLVTPNSDYGFLKSDKTSNSVSQTLQYNSAPLQGTVTQSVMSPSPYISTIKGDVVTVRERLSNIGVKGSPVRVAWEAKYMMPGFLADSPKVGPEIATSLHSNHVFTKLWCDEVIFVATHSDGWSNTKGTGGGPKYDDRIKRKELYPTDDCQLFSAGLQDMWVTIVTDYVAPAVYDEYKFSTQSINIAFVARFSPEGQRLLEYHHDSSSYTVDVCLNSEFQGGGIQYERIGATICPKTPGMMMMHPGRVTHRHRSLAVTGGVRYILVCFIN